ncbi:MAG: hypothetical protein JWO19_287 [Bryobacterales bacterium]|nr:hypothetical protein [Bryobacterales bacterium]
MRLLLAICVFVIPAISIAQPKIYQRRIANSASFAAAGLPAGGIARGSIFSIIGENLGPAGLIIANNYPVGTTLSGVSITVTRGQTTVDALPIAIANNGGVVNAIMPSNAPLGPVSVQVTYNSIKSNPVPATIVNSSFGIYAANAGGFGPGILQNFVSAASTPINTLTQPAKPGQAVVLWGTGLGPITGPDNVTPPAGNLPTPVKIFVGGVSAQVSYSGRAPGYAGSDVLVFSVPSNAPLGCWVPVYVFTDNAITSNVVTMAITADGSPCASSDTSHALSQTFATGGRFGLVQLFRSSIREDIGTSRTYDVVTDGVQIDLRSESAGLFSYNPAFSLPPPGACTVYTVAGNVLDRDPVPGVTPTGAYLKGGTSITVSGQAGGAKIVTPSRNPQSYSQLGSKITGSALADTTMLSPGNYTVTTTAGADVGGFTTSVTVPSPLTWTNRDQISPIIRTQGLTVSWSGVTDGQVVFVTGGVTDVPTNSSGVFYCVAPAGATSFTVPPEILAAIPATRSLTLQSRSLVYLGMAPGAGSAATFTAQGIATGIAMPVYMSGKTVIFK